MTNFKHVTASVVFVVALGAGVFDPALSLETGTAVASTDHGHGHSPEIGHNAPAGEIGRAHV